MGPGGVGPGTLLAPKLKGAVRRLSHGASLARGLTLGLVAIGFWGALFAVFYRVLLHFQGADELGDLLAIKLLGMILLAFLALLLFSNVVTALSSFFLADDLELVVASPSDGLAVYAARLLETLAQSSWMVVLVLVPILAAYGWVYDGGPGFVAVTAGVLLAFLLLPAVAGSAITLILVHVFPARRARDLLALLALFAAGGLVVLIRLLQPEQLASPDAFRDLAYFVTALEAPQSVWLPSEWAAQAVMAALGRGGVDLFPLLLLASTSMAFVVGGAWLHQRLYAEGYSRAQEGAELRAGRRRRRLEAWLGRLPAGDAVRALVAKDVRSFFRDTTQWSQLVLLAVLVLVYVYNVKVLPLWRGQEVGFFLINVISFLNLGLAGFVLAAIAARFLLPALSLEGRTLWLLRSSPLELRTLVWCKFWVGLLPLLCLALVLTAATNWVLRVGPFMMVLSLGTVVVITVTIAALAIAFGALFPRFDTDNAAEVSTGFAGLLFMMTAVTYLAGVIVVEAWPVHALLQARFEGDALRSSQVAGLAAGLAAVVVVSATIAWTSLRVAVRRAATLEP